MDMENVELGTEVVVSQPPLGKREEPILTTAISCLWHSRRYVAAACLVGFIVAAGVAFTILPRYESTTRLMPPDRTETMGLALLASKIDRKSTRLNSSHVAISYAVFCLKKKKIQQTRNKQRQAEIDTGKSTLIRCSIHL